MLIVVLVAIGVALRPLWFGSPWPWVRRFCCPGGPASSALVARSGLRAGRAAPIPIRKWLTCKRSAPSYGPAGAFAIPWSRQ